MKNRKLNNRILSFFIVLCLLIGIVPSTVCAWTAPSTVTINKSTNAAYFTNQWGTSLQTGFYYVAGTNEIAYCADQEGTGPGGTGYSLNDSALGNQAYLAGIQAILQNGYPFTTNGLSADDARYATQIAIHWIENYYLGAGQGYDASIRGTTNANGHDGALAWALALYNIGVNIPFVLPKVTINTPSAWTNVGGTVQCTVQVLEDYTDHWTVTSLPAGTTIVGGTNFSGDVNLIIQLTDPAAYAASNKTLTAVGYTSRDLSNIHVFSASGGYQTMVAVSTQSNGLDPDIVTLQDATGGFAIHKITQTTSGDIPEANAVFQLFSSKYASYADAPDAEKGTITTDANGDGSRSGLPYGSYYLDQISAPAGVTLIPRQTVTVDASSISNPVTYLNTLGYGHIDLTKRINQAGTPLEPGATFQIYLKSAGSYDASPADQRDQIVTDANGHAVSKNLPYGTYSMIQAASPTGTKLNPAVWEYRIGMDGMGNPILDQTIYENVVNDLTSGRLRITKTADIYAEAGATFQIYPVSSASYDVAPADQRDQITTDLTGSATSKFLTYGLYTVHQSAAPAGTIAIADYTVNIGTLDGETVTQSLTNIVQTCKLQIEKQGETLISATKSDSGYKDYDGSALSTYSFQYDERGMNGASFDVFVGSSDIVDYSGSAKTMDLDGNGTRETTLKAGTYLGRITTAAITQSDGSSKYIATMDGLPLSSNGTAQYIAKEAVAPSGQTLSSETLTFDFTYSSQAITEIADLKTLQDTKQDVEITLQKVKEAAVWNSATSSFNWQTVGAQGILFGIYAAWDIKDADGKILVPAGSLVDVMLTDEAGFAKSGADLPFGLYYAKELNVTKDVIIDRDTSYPLVANPSADQTQAVVTVPVNGGQSIVNREIAGVLQINKLAADTSLPMQGVVFEVYDKDGNLVDTMTTDADGKATTKVLPYGKYTLIETKTLTGYILADKSSFNIFLAPKTGEMYSSSELTLSNQKMGKVEVYKVTADGTSTPMNGVVFGVYGSKTDKEVARITTDAKGYGYVYLMSGDYYLKEISTWEGYAIATDKIPVKGVTNGMVYTFREKNDTTTTRIQKASTAGTALAGMQFTVTDAETGKLVEMFYDQSRSAYVALVSDKIKAPEGATIVTQGVTGVDGSTQILGLLAGQSYVFSETAAPSGYNNDSKPVTLTVGTEVLGVVRFVDSQITVTVKTGESSSPLLIELGIGLAGLAAVAAVVLIYKRKRA